MLCKKAANLISARLILSLR